ncbi:phage tail protein [Mameliella alba]|uniref:phage tail protein n=1 Tax=Mameliella alba TaxID=561184 RepID=UPI001C96BD44|nr:phage tail protein [Mameliella alba]MBY6121807.1 phage tail protein [Mameliella alba]
MIRLNILVLALAFLVVGADPAAAEPVSAAIAAVGSWFAGLSVVGQALVRLAVGLVLSKLTQAKLKTPETVGGLKTEATLTGGDNSEGFVLGRYATAGAFVAPPLSWGSRRAQLVYVIDLGLPGQVVSGIYVNGERQAWSGVQDGKGRGELNTGGAYDGRVCRYLYDGTQTAASPYLLNRLGSDPDFPWTPDMVGKGRSYAVLTFILDKGDKAKFSGLPTVLFEIEGLPLYDPRKDGSAGGFGAHRWNDPATWEPTENPAVMIYNILRGIALPNGATWGGRATAEDLPLATWAAAMNECDLSVTVEGGGTEPQYRAGTEVRVAQDEPAQVIEDLLASCSGELVEEGGTWYIQIGAPALPSYFFTDADVVISRPQELDPFPGLADTTNAVAITYPEPVMAWQTKEAPTVLRPDLELEDDGRRQIASLPLPTCPHAIQAQRLAKSYLEDARRFRVHRLTLPPDAAHVPPLSTVAWTSARNGYAAKLFEVQKKQVQLRTLLTQVAVRERDPGDYDWSAADQLPYDVPPATVTTPEPYALEGLSVVAGAISDGTTGRRPAVIATWTEDGAGGVDYEVRLSGGEVIAQGRAPAEAARLVVAEGVLPATDYEARLRPAGEEELFDWSDWLEVTTPDLRLTEADLADTLAGKIDEALDRHDAALADATGVIAELRDAAIASFGPLDRPTALADDIPRLETGLEEAYQRLMGLEWAQFGTNKTLAGAGIFVDSETGAVRIAAFERAEARVSNVEINLSAVEAALELKATVAYVNDTVSQAISEAVLDPSQIPLLDDLDLRITDAEVRLDAAEGTITTLTDTLTVAGGLVSMTTVTQELDSLQGQINQRVTTATFDGLEDRVTTAEGSLTALGDTAAIADAVEVTRQLYDDSADDTQRRIADLWDRWTGDEAVRRATAQGRRDLSARVDAGLAAEASERLALKAAQEATAASLVEESTARAAEDEAQAGLIASLQATLTGAQGEITVNAGAISGLDTRVTAAEGEITSQASSITSLQAGVAAAQGAADAAQADADGNATAISGLDTRVTAAEGEITSQASSITSLQSGVSAALEAADAAQADADGNATAISGLDTRVTAAEGEITSQASSITSLQAGVGDNSAAITTLQNTKVDGAGAVTAVEATISAEYASLTAMASATAFAKAQADGIAAGYVWRLNGQNLIELVSVSDGTSGPVSTYKIAADYVEITGVAQIKSAVLDELFADSIVTGRLEVTGELIVPGAVSDQIVIEALPSTSINGNSPIVTTAQIPQAAAQLWIVAAALEVRTDDAGGVDEVYLQGRAKVGGVWSGWETLSGPFPVSTAFTPIGLSSLFVRLGTDVQFRIFYNSVNDGDYQNLVLRCQAVLK